MAKIITRVWTSRGPTGKKTRHVSYGYDVRIDGQRERTVSAEWTTEAQALDAPTSRASASMPSTGSRAVGT